MFLDELEAWLRTEEGREQLRRLRRGFDSVLAVAREFASAADFRTGRNIAISQLTIAGRVDLEETTVLKIAKFLRVNGWLAQLRTGLSWMTLEQLAEAREAGADGQTHAAAVHALTIPKRLMAGQDSAPLPYFPRLNSQSNVSEKSLASEDAASRQEASTKTPSGPPRRRRRTYPAPSPAMLTFAARLADRLPWLRHNHRLAVCHVLARAGWPIETMDVEDLLTLHELRNITAGLSALTSDQVQHPLGYLRRMLDTALEHAAATEYVPIARRRDVLEAERAQRVAQQLRERAEAAALRARLAAGEEAAAAEAFFAADRELRARMPQTRRERLRDDPELARVRAELDELRRRRGEQ